LFLLYVGIVVRYSAWILAPLSELWSNLSQIINFWE